MIVGAFSYYQAVDIFIIRIQVKYRNLINKSQNLQIVFDFINDYMGYRDDVVSYLLNQAPKDQQEYFGIFIEKPKPSTTSSF